MQNFAILDELGGGSFGTVQKVRRLSDWQLYAMKVVKYIRMNQRNKNNALNQIRMLASIQHQNVIKYKQAFLDSKTGNLCTVMQLAEGDLAQRIKSRREEGGCFSENEIWEIGHGVIEGIGALHAKNILHRDIKPANIFFGADGQTKLGDLNVSLCLKEALAYTQTGTPYYASPEVWNDIPYSFECDIWSFGCVLYEMCCLTRPFRGQGLDEIYDKVRRCRFERLPHSYSDQLRQVIHGCLAPKRNRWSLSKLRAVFAANPFLIAQNTKTLSPQNQQALIDTISVPNTVSNLAQCLPKSQYEQSPESPQQNNPEQALQTSLDKQLKPQIKTYIKKQENSPNYPILDQFLIHVDKIKDNIRVKHINESANNNHHKYGRNLHQYKSEKLLKAEPGQIRIVHNFHRNISQKYLSAATPYKPSQALICKSLSSQQAVNYCEPSRNAAKNYHYELDRFNLRRRRLRLAMNY